MSGLIGTFMANAQNAADTAKQAREMGKNARKTQDGRRIYKIACLGHARSGKTTYWSVFHEASRGRMDEFNIQTGDNTTAAYLVRQREAMQSGAFYIPAPGEKPADYEPGYPPESDLLVNLLFMAREGGGREIPIMVQDYPGRAISIEDTDGRAQEVVEFLKGADGILFFVDAYSTRESPHKLTEQLLGFNSLLKHLEDRHGRINRPVGLVLTKADMLDEYRPANPSELISDADQRRRGEIYSKFLAQLLKGNVFAQDAAWKTRVEKTLTRLRSFADALLKKTQATQFFVVSAVGDKRRRPIEPAAAGDSIANTSMAASSSSMAFAVGRHETGMEEPLRWMIHQLLVKNQVRKADRLRNGALAAAAVYSLALTLPFLLYLGCAVPRLEADLRKEPLPALQILKDTRGFEENHLVKLWSVMTRHHDFLPSAQAIRTRVADRVVEEGRNALLTVLSHNKARGVNPDPEASEFCSRWGFFLETCTQELRDSTADYRDSRAKMYCLRKVFIQAGTNFKLASTNDRRDAFLNLTRLAGTQLCMEDTVKLAAQALADGITKDDRIAPAPVPSAAAGGGGGGGGPSLKDSYNTAVAQFGPGSPPESRVSLKLISDLEGLLASRYPHDAVSVEVEKRIHAYLSAVEKFKNGTPLKLKVTQLSSPARLKLPEVSGEREYLPDDEISIPRWKLNSKVRFVFYANLNSAPLVLDDLVGKQNQPLQVNLPAKAGGNVVFQFEVSSPPVTDETVPPLSKIP